MNINTQLSHRNYLSVARQLTQIDEAFSTALSPLLFFPSPPPPSHRKRHRVVEPSPFEQWLAPATYYDNPAPQTDEFKEYSALRPTEVENILFWWRDRIFTYPRMAQMAFDILSIPAMSSECERVFSQTKLLLTTQRSRLADEIIEAVELLKHWYKTGAV